MVAFRLPPLARAVGVGAKVTKPEMLLYVPVIPAAVATVTLVAPRADFRIVYGFGRIFWK